jgi:hypothetical protein
MKKLFNLGKALSKAEQRSVTGGFIHADCEQEGDPCYKYYRDSSGNLVIEEGVCNSSMQCIF